MSGMRIGEVAQASGTTAKTLRYYEDVGLLPDPDRSPAGYRDYGPEVLDRLHFIRRGQAAGLTLAQIGQVLAIRDRGQAPCQHVTDLLDTRLAVIDRQLAELAQLRTTIAILRELGILLTAIIVAGRTASALTASIGSMKMNEEIDAMRTLGLDPDMVLLLPRVLALIITLPILGLISDVAGLVGGGLMSWIDLGISPAMFTYRLLADTDVSHVFVGLVKAPVFAVIIGVIGCHAGMKVGKDAESLGAQTSGSVVRAIFAVIVADALFSIFFSELGL